MKIEVFSNDAMISSKYVNSVQKMLKKYWDEYKTIVTKDTFIQPKDALKDDSIGDDSFKVIRVTIGYDFVSYWIERVPYDYEYNREGV